MERKILVFNFEEQKTYILKQLEIFANSHFLTFGSKVINRNVLMCYMKPLPFDTFGQCCYQAVDVTVSIGYFKVMVKKLPISDLEALVRVLPDYTYSDCIVSRLYTIEL